MAAERIMDDGWPTPPFVALTAAQDARNTAVFKELIDRNVESLWTYFSQEREEVAEELLRERLPRSLHGLMTRPRPRPRPRLLKLALRLRPKWKPSFIQPSGYTTKTAAEAFGQTWLRDMAERGKVQPNVGALYQGPDLRWKAVAVRG